MNHQNSLGSFKKKRRTIWVQSLACVSRMRLNPGKEYQETPRPWDGWGPKPFPVVPVAKLRETLLNLEQDDIGELVFERVTIPDPEVAPRGEWFTYPSA